MSNEQPKQKYFALEYGYDEEFDGWSAVMGILTEKNALAAKQAVSQANERLQKKHRHYIRLCEIPVIEKVAAGELFNEVYERAFGPLR